MSGKTVTPPAEVVAVIDEWEKKTLESEKASIPALKKRGRPTIPKDERISLRFNLTVLPEEMELFRISAKMLGLPSVAFFLRSAIEDSREHSVLMELGEVLRSRGLSEKLFPVQYEAGTVSHFTLLLSIEGRERLDLVDIRSRSEFIRIAALNKVMRITVKNPDFETALRALKSAKGVR